MMDGWPDLGELSPEPQLRSPIIQTKRQNETLRSQGLQASKFFPKLPQSTADVVLLQETDHDLPIKTDPIFAQVNHQKKVKNSEKKIWLPIGRCQHF